MMTTSYCCYSRLSLLLSIKNLINDFSFCKMKGAIFLNFLCCNNYHNKYHLHVSSFENFKVFFIIINDIWALHRVFKSFDLSFQIIFFIFYFLQNQRHWFLDRFVSCKNFYNECHLEVNFFNILCGVNLQKVYSTIIL